MHLFINGLAASAGGGTTYLRNLIPQIARRSDVRATVLVPPDLRDELPILANVAYQPAAGASGIRRALREGTLVRALVAQHKPDVLLSTGNFAIRKSPVPQILLSRNALYTSDEFKRDLRSRGEYALLLDTLIKGVLAKKSIGWADCTIAPSDAFAQDLHKWTGRNIVAVHHGFDRELFLGGSGGLPATARDALARSQDTVRLLFVSHYNYYRNFETVFKAVAILRRLMKQKRVTLLLTCKLDGAKDGAYRTDRAAATIRELAISENVVELGPIPYQSLHELYRACDIYVTAAYAETFAHPLVEAMACGIPIVASDLGVHKEICGDAALYFPRFASDELAACVMKIIEFPDMKARLGANGVERSEAFSWERHLNELLGIAAQLVNKRRKNSGQ